MLAIRSTPSVTSQNTFVIFAIITNNLISYSEEHIVLCILNFCFIIAILYFELFL
jgi:hypothetical protein